MIVDSIKNGPYVRQMIATPGEPDLSVPFPESFHKQMDEELTENDIKRMDANDQAIQTILLGLPEDVYAIVDSFETTKEIWKRVRQMMKGSDIGEQEKKAKLFNEWEKFTSTDEESIESYYHHSMQLMNDLKRNKHFPENIASNLNTHTQQSFPINNKYNPQPSLNQNFMQPPMTFLEDINDPTKVMNAALILFAKAFQLTAPTNNNQRTSSNPPNRQIAQPVMNMNQDRKTKNVRGNSRNQFRQYDGQVAQINKGTMHGIMVGFKVLRMQVKTRVFRVVEIRKARCYNYRGLGHIARNSTTRPRRRDAAYLQTQLLIAQKEEVGIQLQAEEFDFMATAGDLDEIEEVNDGSAEYTDLLEPNPEPQLVPQNDNHVTSVAPSMVQSGGTVATSFAPNKETHAHQETVYRNLVDQVAQEELFLSNVSNMVTVSKMISIQNEDLSDDTTPSVAQKFLNEVKSSLVTLQRVVKQKMTLEVHNWSSSAHKEADESLDKQKSLELEIEHLLKASVSHDIMCIVQNSFVDVPSDLQTELDRTKEKLELCIIKKKKEYVVLWNNCASITLDSLNQKLESKIVELEFQVVNYEREVSHLKTTYKNLFHSIKSNRAHAKLHNLIYENAKLRSRVFENTSESMSNTSGMSENVSSNTVTASSTGLAHTARTRRPQPKDNTRNDRVPSTSKSSEVKKIVTIEDHRRTLLLSKNQKTMSSECNNIKLAIRNDKSKIVCDTCKQCLVTANHDACLPSFVNALNSRANKLCATPLMTGNIKLLINFVWKFLGTVRFGNDHIAAILGYGDLKWGNITITRVYFIEGLGHNLFSVGQFCDADLEVAFRRNTCFIRDLDGVDLLKGNRSTNLYTINLYDMASASPICLMAREPTKSWLSHQQLSHLNFDTINDLTKNDLVSSLPMFKYAKKHLCPSCKQGKSKRASHPPKPILNSKQRLHLLDMDLCGPMQVVSNNGKWYVLKIYVCLKSPVIIGRIDNRTKFKNQVLKEYFDSVGITHETSAAKTPQQNGFVEHRNRMLVEAARTILIFSYALSFLWAKAITTACYTQNCSIIHRRFNKTPYELIQGRKPDISYLYVFWALCYPKNDREDIGKLDAKGDIGFFIGYSANFVSYRVYNQRTKKIMETMNITFNELLGMADMCLNTHIFDPEEAHDEEEEEDELYRDVNKSRKGNGVNFLDELANGCTDSNLCGPSSYWMNEAVKVAIQIQSDRLRDEAQKENDKFLKTIDEKMQKIIKEQVNEQVKRNLYKALVKAYESDKIILDTYGDTITLKRRRNDYADKDEEPFAGSDRGSKRRREGKEPESASAPNEKATRSADKSTQGQSAALTNLIIGLDMILFDDSPCSETKELLLWRSLELLSILAEELMQTTFQMEEPSHPEFEIGADDQPIVESSQHPEWFSQQKKPPTLDRDWNKTFPATYGSIQPWINKLAKQSDSRSSFNKLMDTPVDFSNFVMNRLKVDTLTLELLAGLTYELIKGSCKSLVELEFFLEEVYKATTDQLDWVNPEVRRDDDKLYKFKECDFKRLCIQDIESIVIQRRVEDLQLSVKSYQKKLNLTRPDTYRSDLKRKEAYSAYANLRGFIYQNKDKHNRLMQIDELHKFNGGTLTDAKDKEDHEELGEVYWRKAVRGRLQDASKDHMIYHMLFLSFKRWNEKSPLCNLINYSTLLYDSDAIKIKVADLIGEDGWKWPRS
nr:retrovirus-related Pol polyprotein from transposon TNT 1-94 [Tanacetum cinerariifolium]